MDVANKNKVFNKLSAYANNLPQASRMRYVAKISDINFTDPYTAYLTEKDFPTSVTAGHVVQYLLNHAASGGNHMKNTRSVEAYKKFESGFVHSVSGGIINDLHVVRGKVNQF